MITLYPSNCPRSIYGGFGDACDVRKIFVSEKLWLHSIDGFYTLRSTFYGRLQTALKDT